MTKSGAKDNKTKAPIYSEYKKPKSLVELRKILDRLKNK